LCLARLLDLLDRVSRQQQGERQERVANAADWRQRGWVFVIAGVLRGGSLAVHSLILAVIGALLFACGIALAVWARLHLGRNWGMLMTQRAEPELVTSGPYSFVRHPIYSGLLTAMLGTALVNNLLSSSAAPGGDAGLTSQIASFTSVTCPTRSRNRSYAPTSRRTLSSSGPGRRCRATVFPFSDRVRLHCGPCLG